jgi:hypothetical protein
MAGDATLSCTSRGGAASDLRVSLRAQDINFTRARQGVDQHTISEMLVMLNSIELQTPSPPPPRTRFSSNFVSTLCDSTHVLRDLERGVSSGERARCTATSCSKVGNKSTLLKSKPGYNEYCQSTSYDALDGSV